MSSKLAYVSRIALTLATALIGALLVVPSAGAFVATVGSAKVGLQPRSTLLGGTPLNIHEFPLEPEKFANTQGNAIVNSSKIYAIYWDPTKDYYHGDWQNVIDTFLHKMGAASSSLGNVFAVDAQYTDAANQHALYKSTFQGAYTDTSGYPSSKCEDPHPLEPADRIGPPHEAEEHTSVCLTSAQVEEQLEDFIAQHGLPKGMGSIFYVLTPPGVTVCLDGGGPTGHCSDFKGSMAEIEADEKERETDEHVSPKKSFIETENYKSYKNSFCSYHSDVSSSNSSGGENMILYGMIPWTAGGLGDFHLESNDRISAFDCQDGGWDPSKSQEKYEEKKEKTAKEIAEDKEKTPEEQERIAEAEKLEGPHPQEPNQVKCTSPDGACDTGLADLIINQIAVEQENIVTDPLLDAWQDPSGNEATDECRDAFAPVRGGNVGAQEISDAGTLYDQELDGNQYYVNEAFNLAALKLPYPGVPCLTGVSLVPQFTAPNTVNTNEIVGFDGMESDISLNAGTSFNADGVEHPSYATYTWNFGDGSEPVTGYAPGASLANSPNVSTCGSPTEWEPPCAASVYHSYAYGGIYEVSLTVTDVGGNVATIKEPITVVGPAPPSPEPPPTPGPTPPPTNTNSGGSGTSTSATSTTAQTPTQSPVVTPPPVLGAAVTSKSLKKALSGGLPVHYTTNEQVAGSIQVLLETSTAKRLGIKGTTATGLPAGTPSSIVVGTAVLVTTKAGQGTIRVKFSPRAASRLKHTRKLKVTLRVFARNASRQAPQTTTMLSTVVLNP